jgi:hypothetical protein
MTIVSYIIEAPGAIFTTLYPKTIIKKLLIYTGTVHLFNFNILYRAKLKVT